MKPLKQVFRKIGHYILAVIFLPLILTCCTPQAYKDYSSVVDQTHQQLNNDLSNKIALNSQLGPVSLDVSSKTNESWLNPKISIHAQDMPFNQVANKILQGTAASNAFEQGVNQTQTVSINYHGSRKDALKLLSTQTGIAYAISDNQVTWSTLMTKTFDVSFMPGSSKYLVGENNNNSSGNGSNTGSSSNSSTTAGTTNNMLGNNGEYSSIQGDLSIWADLDSAIKSMLSKDGKVNVSQATTTITVTDHPENVSNIEQYLKNMDRDMSRQVALNVEVLEVNLNDSFSYGIDWNLVRNFMSGRYGIKFVNTSSAQTSTNPINSTAPDTLLFSATSGVWAGTNTFINALALQGKVSVATQPRVVTLNNQVAEIGINTQTSYLAEVTTTATAQVGTSTSLTPGEITSGFTLYLLPKIQGNNVYLQISSTIATLDSITPQTAGGNSGTNLNTIYVPVVSQKRFNQRSVVPSGATLVLAGFKQLSNTSEKSSVLGTDKLGGTAGDRKNIETIVLITPTVLNLKG